MELLCAAVSGECGDRLQATWPDPKLLLSDCPDLPGFRVASRVSVAVGHNGVEGGGAFRVRDTAVPRSEHRRVRDCVLVCVEEDATGLSRGVSGWTLHFCQPAKLDATALCRGGSRSQLKSRDRETPRGKPVASSTFKVTNCDLKDSLPAFPPWRC